MRVLFGLLLGTQAWAEGEAPASPGLGSMLLQVLGALLLVTTLIIGMAWLAKRFSLIHPSSNAQLKPLASLALGRKEKVVLVEAAGKTLLLGVTPSSVNFLCDLTENVSSEANHSAEQAVNTDSDNTIRDLLSSGEEKPLFSNFLKKCIGNNHRES